MTDNSPGSSNPSMSTAIVAEFAASARRWLTANAEPLPDVIETSWGEGDDSIGLFHNLSFEDEQALIDAGRHWQQRKADAGYGSIDWDPSYGGAGLTREYASAFVAEESQFVTPPMHEAVGITLYLVGPTIRAWGTPEQRERFLPPLLRTDEMWCQLFSEPGAGSDLARLSTRAVRDGDEWVLDGQKVWTSGAQFADYGYMICRTDADLPKHKGLTAFLVPLRTPGIEIRPLRQMTGGCTFNEVFFDGVRLSDSLRLGAVGEGWKVAMTTLGHERGASGDLGSIRRWQMIRLVAEHLGLTSDPIVRQDLARLYTELTVLRLTNERVAANLRSGQTPGPEGSIGKLAWTQSLSSTASVVTSLLGAALTADTGEWGTYSWSQFVTGIPGRRIAAGSDEIQRNVIGERVLGLPREPSVDRDVPYRSLVGDRSRTEN